MTRHLWITAPSGACDLAPLARVDAHRRLRGPYTAAGSVVRLLVPGALRDCPQIVARHDVEVPTVAPELRGMVTCDRETLTLLAPPEERTRFYPPNRTQRIAHGLTEMLRDVLRAQGGEHRALVIERMAEADPTDAEWVTTLLRRIDPELLRIVVCAAAEPVDGVLGEALRRHAERRPGAGAPPPAERTARERPAAGKPDAGESGDAARRSVASECTSADPRLAAAYDALPAADRAALHDARAEQLERAGELSLRLGALPFHRERGADPRARAREPCSKR